MMVCHNWSYYFMSWKCILAAKYCNMRLMNLWDIIYGRSVGYQTRLTKITVLMSNLIDQVLNAIYDYKKRGSFGVFICAFIIQSIHLIIFMSLGIITSTSYCFSLSHNVVIPRTAAQPFHSWNIYPSLDTSWQFWLYKRLHYCRGLSGWMMVCNSWSHYSSPQNALQY